MNTKPLKKEASFASEAVESPLSEETLQSLKELGSTIGDSFFPDLLETFKRDAACHLGALRSAIASGDTGRLREEGHALKGASRTIGAELMARYLSAIGEPRDCARRAGRS